MLNLVGSIGLGVLLALIFYFLNVTLWFGIPFGLAAGIALFIYLGRQVQQKLEAIFKRAGDQLNRQPPLFEKAIETMKEGYAFSNQQFLVRGSIDGQIGMVQYLRDKEDEAIPLLRSASMQHYMAKAMLAVIEYKQKNYAEVHIIMKLALRAAKKESMLYALYAYFLSGKMNDRNEAIAVLNKGLKVLKNDERLLNNRNALQNGKEMKMSVYGAAWYQFKIERPKMMMQPPPFARMSGKGMRR